MRSSRVSEGEIDRHLIAGLRTEVSIRQSILSACGLSGGQEAEVRGQSRHKCDPGSIDVEIAFDSGLHLLIENKIDAAFSVTKAGVGQPVRYQRSVLHLRRCGRDAYSILLAPESYFRSTCVAEQFDRTVSYEALLHAFPPEARLRVELAIAQASEPYEPTPNIASLSFFNGFRAMVAANYRSLTMKANPNASGARPTESRTIYFVISETLIIHPGVPRPRMSLQCWDKNAPSASAKIMIAGWSGFASKLNLPQSLQDIGAYLRPAGKSLGIVIDTPRLETQIPVHEQFENIHESLQASVRLQEWWNQNFEELREWSWHVARFS